jgi:hypothetical protein
VTTDTNLMLEQNGTGEATVELLSEIGRQLVPLPYDDGSSSVPAEPISGEFPYSCEADVFTVIPDGVTSAFDRLSD